MNRILLVVLLALLIHMPARADSYNYEARADYLDSEDERTKNKTTRAQLKYFITPVEIDNGPLEEAEFLTRASFLGLAYQKIETKFRSFPSIASVQVSPTLNGSIAGAVANGDLFPVALPASTVLTNEDRDIDEVEAFGRHVFNSGLIVALAYKTGDSSQSRETEFVDSREDIETDNVTFSIGQYWGDNLTVDLSLSRRDVDQNERSIFNSVTCSITLMCQTMASEFKSGVESTTTRWRAGAKRLWQIGDYAHTLSGHIGYETFKSNGYFEISRTSPTSMLFAPDRSAFSEKSYGSEIGLAYRFYPRNNLGIGVDYTVADNEFFDTKQLGVDLRWFVKPGIAVHIGYQKIDGDFTFADADGFVLGLTGRL